MLKAIAFAILAAAGDADYLVRESFSPLTAPQRTALVSFASPLVNFAIATTTNFYCNRAQMSCFAIGQATGSESSYLADEDAGAVVDIVSASGGNVTYTQRSSSSSLASGDVTRLAAFLTSVGSAATTGTIQDLACDRVASTISCRIVYRKQATPAAYVADRLAGNVVLFIRRLP
jgi:hypothetical protein